MNGEVTWYNEKQGFGFISGSQGGNRFYFHAPQRELFSVGQRVTFDTQNNPDNGMLIAINVKAGK